MTDYRIEFEIKGSIECYDMSDSYEAEQSSVLLLEEMGFTGDSYRIRSITVYRDKLSEVET